MRSTEFFARVTHIYGAYKLTQLRAAVMRAQGRPQEQITEQLWDGQHTWAGQQMYDLCISLRGFYLKVRQPPGWLVFAGFFGYSVGTPDGHSCVRTFDILTHVTSCVAL